MAMQKKGDMDLSFLPEHTLYIFLVILFFIIAIIIVYQIIAVLKG